MQTAGDLSRARVRAAPGLKRTVRAIGCPGCIDDCFGFGDVRTRLAERTPLAPQRLVPWATVLISMLIPSEVTAREGSVLAFRLVPYWDVRFDLLIVDQPAEHRSGAVGSIGDQARGFNPQPILNPIDHNLSGLGLLGTVRGRGLNVHDHPSVHVH